MTETNEPNSKKPLTLSGSSKLEMKRPAVAGQVRQKFSHGRSKTVTVEVKKKRSVGRVKEAAKPGLFKERPAPVSVPDEVPAERPGKGRVVLKALTDGEKATRVRALEDSKVAAVEARERAKVEAERLALDEARFTAEREAADVREAVESERKKDEEEAKRKAAEKAAQRFGDAPQTPEAAEEAAREAARRPRRLGLRPDGRRAPVRRSGERRREGKLTISEALTDRERVRSLASVRRAREREKRQAAADAAGQGKIFRDVIIPDTITVQELANRMAERSVDVIKVLMKMDVMAAVDQELDADTAELVVSELGHRPKRVSAADVEIGFRDEADDEASLMPRPPVVTVMGHVDHGKTSLLDALRETDVVSGEAGGITQHIGAYQVHTKSGGTITFIDTPGHEAFTAMRARGAQITDLVVLVVAADDGIMPQTVEAIRHAQAAKVPIIVAINKMDRPDADANRVRQGLLQHELVVEEMGGDVLAVEVSAKEKTNLDKLEETIMLQAELMELKANPDRQADGVVVEAKLDKGRGTVATVLVQRGTLRVGDIVVAGREWGRVRRLLDEHGDSVDEVRPSQPAEVLGLNGTPMAGDEFGVVESESRARDIAEFRDQRERAKIGTVTQRSVEDWFKSIEEGKISELPIVIKADVQGSLEAIAGALEKLSTDEVAVKILHGAVGGINESDVTLAQASTAIILGFNVRANAQARSLAKRDKVEIRYFSIIYEVVDEIRNLLSGLLAPAVQETTLGRARVKEVFNVSKIGMVAGCEVLEGLVRRGAKARLIRDDVVVHEGSLGTLRHFKDDVREVKVGSDCGISFENYQDIQREDVIEAYEAKEVARSL